MEVFVSDSCVIQLPLPLVTTHGLVCYSVVLVLVDYRTLDVVRGELQGGGRRLQMKKKISNNSKKAWFSVRECTVLRYLEG